jgi:tetratricopeptide (TPR) repeat protein
MKTVTLLFMALFLSITASRGVCQETVFTVLKKDLQLADQYYSERRFKSALKLYLAVASKHPSVKDIYLKIARSYHFLKEYSGAVTAYEQYRNTNQTLPSTDIYYFAEAQAATLRYDGAVDAYQEYLSKAPSDEMIIKKIWRLNNIQFLYEDSLHFAVRPVAVNSEHGELCAVPYGSGIVFLSNRKETQVVDNVDASLNTPFYRFYYAKFFQDTTRTDTVIFNLPLIFNKALNGRFHAGPLAFYDKQQKMVFSSTRRNLGKQGGRTLQVYFARHQDGRWKVTHEFPYNSLDYSLTDPTISEDGNVLYFSSDMKGGFGERDIYRSEYINGQWTKPKNLGEFVNTRYDEVFPHLHHHTLYFSSNGHAGMGGLDIFKIDADMKGFDEAQNIGYPLNTNFDDFGIVIDSLGNHGYFSSNRYAGGYNDNIFEFDMDLQTYPLQISGLIRFKEHSWSDSLDLKIMPHARVSLIDNIRNVTVHESNSDAEGNFSIVIPYFSKYRIRVVGEDNDENIVSLEIPKHRRSYNQHEIVVVKDAFKSN